MFTDSSKVKLINDSVWEVECNVSILYIFNPINY